MLRRPGDVHSYLLLAGGFYMDYDYIVLYDSSTGNTKKLATEIFTSLPGRDKDLLPINEYRPDHTAFPNRY